MKRTYRLALALLLVLSVMLLAGCKDTILAKNTGLVVNTWFDDGGLSFISYLQDANVIEDGVDSKGPYVVLSFTNTSRHNSQVYDVRFKRSKSTTETGNWLNPSESLNVRMYVGDSLSIYDDGHLCGTYVLTTGHYLPESKRIPVERTKEATNTRN